MEKLLKFRVVGDKITPESISSNEFSKLITAYEDALIALFDKENPDKKELGYISVVGIKNESAGILFKPNYVDELLSAANKINDSINNKSISKLPYRTVENLSIIQTFVSQKKCSVELNGYEGIASTKITPETNLHINKSFYIKGETTIYGKVINVGGVDPKVRLEFDNGVRLSVKIKESEAKILSPHLYEVIGVRGVAKWKKEDYELTEIRPKSFIIMKEKDIEEKFKGLSDLLGKYWVDIDNPDEYVKSLRS